MDIKNPPKIDIDQLKEVIKITELAKQLGIELNRSNKALCVFHNEKTPSLSFNDEKGIFKCFSCDKSGDIIDLYKEIKQVDTGQAIKELAESVGLAPATHKGGKFAVRGNFRDNTSQTQKKPTTSENKGQYSKIYEELVCLCVGLDEESEKYLKSDKRGLTDETIKRFLLCSVKDYAKTNQLLKEKFSLDELKQAGIMNDNGNLLFFKHRLLIPFFNDSGDNRIVFIQGRLLDNATNKYLHLKGVSVPLFHSDILKDLKRGDSVYICEGVFDAMMLEQNGYNAVAILGVNNFKPEMTHQFKGLDVVLAFDNDEAGERATKEVAKIFLLNGQEVKTKRLPENVKDITDYFIKTKK